MSSLVTDRRVSRATSDRKIITGHDDRTPIDIGSTKNEIGRCKRLKITIFIVLADAREFAYFMEGLSVNNRVHALTDREFAEFVLAGDFLVAAHGFCRGSALVHFVDFLFPGHVTTYV